MENKFKTIEAMKNEIIDSCYNLEDEIIIESIYFTGVKKNKDGYIDFIRRIVIKPSKLDFNPAMIKRVINSYINNYSELLIVL